MLVLIFIPFLHSVTKHVLEDEDVPDLWQAGACTVHLLPSLKEPQCSAAKLLLLVSLF